MIYTNSRYAHLMAADEADKYKRLSQDLEEFFQGNKPSEGDLAVAPILENYSLIDRPVFALQGTVFGHPTIMDGPLLSSEVVLFDPVHRWMRTRSRYYRLGHARPRDGA
ncbi:DUF6634 family protein [Nitrospirillum pindoramense]|uniref:DUF6634 family protein n=1 Tax=Nitrospirillum amazonense TaxID=28077 RepID=UPI0011A5E9F9|nr:DUF6634 family protein [Nitrospirillum amazonense]